MRRPLKFLISILTTLLLLSSPIPAMADLTVNTDLPQKAEIRVESSRQVVSPTRTKTGKKAFRRTDQKPKKTGERELESAERNGSTDQFPADFAKVKAEIERGTKRYATELNAWDACVTGGGGLPCPRPIAPDLPDLPIPLIAEPSGLVPREAEPQAAQPQVVLDPQTVAYAAVANLDLIAPTPGIGPSPDLNRWNMAAVGYPLWLWAEGNVDPAPVSDTIYNLSVSLNARVSRIDFVMGDGNSVSCASVGTRWVKGTPAGAESPTCGYRYEKPSLPGDAYTVTARTHWAIDWSINGQSGTIPLVQAASTELPVGELQALVR